MHLRCLALGLHGVGHHGVVYAYIIIITYVIGRAHTTLHSCASYDIDMAIH
jgi:hypothetical protein